MKTPNKELEILRDSSAKSVQAALAEIESKRLEGDTQGRDAAIKRFAKLLVDLQSAADVLGRQRLLIELGNPANLIEGRQFAFKIPFLEAVKSLVERKPTLAIGWRAAQEAYNRGAFALAKATSDKIAKRVQSVISTAIKQGRNGDSVRSDIVAALKSGDSTVPGASITKSYADTVFRTNITSAYTQGRTQQVRDPSVRKVIGAWRYSTAGDVDVRDNHAAADDLVAAIDDPVWRDLTPPMGYQCRCILEMVPVDEAERLGVIDGSGNAIEVSHPQGAFRDPGFVSVRSVYVK